MSPSSSDPAASDLATAGPGAAAPASESPRPGGADNSAALTYEAARDELRGIVQALETGSAPLEETLELWKRGEELVRYCQHILLSAQRTVAAADDAAAGEEPLQG